ncbi:substrate-binding domain-containing protein [Streptomyces sp. NPDC086838]|uniref:substrate-binding domain-containing protein n=1 Tax=Streptomyces sp. NPDC086838 TaxID=3365762 RepID=UPI00382F97ED
MASDLMAKGALRTLRTLRRRGRTVPDDVAVVGFDDLASVSVSTDPPLTTVRQDIEGMGRTMARLLVRELYEHGTGTRARAAVITPTTLIRRGAACPPHPRIREERYEAVYPPVNRLRDGSVHDRRAEV